MLTRLNFFNFRFKHVYEFKKSLRILKNRYFGPTFAKIIGFDPTKFGISHNLIFLRKNDLHKNSDEKLTPIAKLGFFQHEARREVLTKCGKFSTCEHFWSILTKIEIWT